MPPVPFPRVPLVVRIKATLATAPSRPHIAIRSTPAKASTPLSRASVRNDRSLHLCRHIRDALHSLRWRNVFRTPCARHRVAPLAHTLRAAQHNFGACRCGDTLPPAFIATVLAACTGCFAALQRSANAAAALALKLCPRIQSDILYTNSEPNYTTRSIVNDTHLFVEFVSGQRSFEINNCAARSEQSRLRLLQLSLKRLDGKRVSLCVFTPTTRHIQTLILPPGLPQHA